MTSALTVAMFVIAAAVPTSHAASATSTPQLLHAELVTAPEIHPGTIAVVFRTTHTLARGRNGGTLKGRAGLGWHTSSILTVHGPNGHACYVAYENHDLRVGRRYLVTISIGDTDHRRMLPLRRPHHVAERGADLGC